MKKFNMLSTKNIYLVLLLLFAFISGSYLSKNYSIEPIVGVTARRDIPSTTDTNIDLGQISMKEGNVQLEYLFENTTGEPLNLNNLYTSCMCTKAKIISNNEETPFAGMRGHTSGLMPLNPNMTLNPGQKAELLVEFDPNAHGPRGTGPMTREIVIETDNPNMPIIKFNFSGVVVQ